MASLSSAVPQIRKVSALVVGDSEVPKTTLILAYEKKGHPGDQIPSFYQYTEPLTADDGTQVLFEVSDCSGTLRLNFFSDCYVSSPRSSSAAKSNNCTRLKRLF